MPVQSVIMMLQSVQTSQLSSVLCDTVGRETNLPGQSCGSGLTSEAADDLGLKAGLPVATSSIDAHAGALGINSSPLYFLFVDRNSAFNVLTLLMGHQKAVSSQKIALHQL